TEVTNIGDETTTIKLFSYFPSRIAHIDMSKSYSGKNFKVTDISGNTITDYDEGFAVDHPDWPISVAAVGGLHLAPNAGIIFYYKLIVDETGDLFVPPVSVEYDSRYPMAGASGVEGVSGESGETNPLARKLSTSIAKDGLSTIKFSIQDQDSSSSKWTSFSGASLMSAYAAVSPPEETSTEGTGPQTPSGGVNGFTTLTSFISENMRLMIVVLAIPILVLSVRELRRTRK
ncbi:MAG: hypothetical protein ACFFFH_14955, partial [Candidatus Thorarchaeota archaeon]